MAAKLRSLTNLLLVCVIWLGSPILCTAWAPASSSQLSLGRTTPARPAIHGSSSSLATIFWLHRRRPSPLFPLSMKVDDESSEPTLQTRFQKFIRSLGRGILFAKPIGPTVSQALFGIQSHRKNERQLKRTGLAFTLREGLIAIAIYLAIGVTFYSVIMEHWSIIDSMYYSIVLFTTVGYGDLLPHSWAAKMFTCFFSLGGIAFLAAALASIGSNIVETELRAVQAAKKITQKKVLFGLKKAIHRKQQQQLQQQDSEEIHTENINVTAVVPFTAPVTLEEPKPPPTLSLLQVGQQLFPRFVFLVAGGLLFGRLEGWSPVDSIYYGLITAGTVGLGDFSPKKQSTRLLATIFIPLAVAAGGEILGTIASAFLQRRRAQLFDNMVNKDFSMDHIKEMDSNGDGEVSRLEYLEFMLVEMQLVERSVIEELQSQFDRLDVTKGGTLSKDDLILMAKMRRKKEEEEAAAAAEGTGETTS